MNSNGYNHKYGAVEPHDIEDGRDLTETKNVLRSGGARSKLLEDAHPRTSLLAASKREEQNWWQRTNHQLREAITKDRIVALVIWIAVLVFIILIVIRIVHVEKQKHKHH